MKTVMMQSKAYGEKFKICQTECETLESAWGEINDRPEVGGWISFKDEREIMKVNGGFHHSEEMYGEKA
ncbi:hypothetical protein [Acetobacterium bakii]|uniref:Uncharacterized protein n=1 Tax=Acetobacterium bakii TaxID=52689 RepID=A0A0L6U583_9FIRM|nr:hypothetical protein [Acetobacterium bakii]KNZ43482.1 hypothetical protein AKG39_00840 [Acetobacterium bakii]